ncbi:hypothetical protein BGV60_22310 [Burkholderia ubonensis]|nr:hypothetical protein BGV59_19910 [Burkholderia ubonensis]OJB49611.1 hypothetical protein BGV60_22310 [Burkholderia ubonensis]
MGVGFQMWDQDGRMLVDSDRACAGFARTFVRSGDMGKPAGLRRVYGDGHQFLTYRAPEGFASPLFFFRGPFTVLRYFHRNGNEFTIGWDYWWPLTIVTPPTIVYVYDRMRDMGTGHGLQTFDAGGKLTFDSNMGRFRLVGGRHLNNQEAVDSITGARRSPDQVRAFDLCGPGKLALSCGYGRFGAYSPAGNSTTVYYVAEMFRVLDGGRVEVVWVQGGDESYPDENRFEGIVPSTYGTPFLLAAEVGDFPEWEWAAPGS